MSPIFEYRVLERDGEVAVYEVFYDDDGKPASCTVEALSPSATTVDDLRHELEAMLRALDAPPLRYEDIVAPDTPAER